MPRHIAYSRLTCRVRNLLLVPFVMTVAGCTMQTLRDERPTETTATAAPLSELAAPLGQLVLLEGVRAQGPKTGVHTFEIDHVDGRVPSAALRIWVDNVDLPDNERCVLRGYETISMIGKAPAFAQLARLRNQPPPSEPQAVWQVFHTFVVLEVVEPKSLKIKNAD